MENKEKKDAPVKKEDQKKTNAKGAEYVSAKTDNKSAKETKAAKATERDNSNEGKEFREFFIDELRISCGLRKLCSRLFPRWVRLPRERNWPPRSMNI